MGKVTIKPRKVRLWCAFGPSPIPREQATHYVNFDTLRGTRREAIEAAEDFEGIVWGHLYRLGWRVARVRVVLDGGSQEAEHG